MRGRFALAADVIERSVAPPRSERVTAGVTKCVTRKIFAAEMAQAQPGDPAAPFVPVADYNIIADPAEFAGALLEVLGK